jgi:hypothetical protein
MRDEIRNDLRDDMRELSADEIHNVAGGINLGANIGPTILSHTACDSMGMYGKNGWAWVTTCVFF